MREDLAYISLKAKNKELDLLEEKSFGPKGKDDEAEEEAEAKVGTSIEQEKSLADNTENADSSWFVRNARESLEEDAEWVTGYGIDNEDTSEAKNEAPKNQENSIT